MTRSFFRRRRVLCAGLLCVCGFLVFADAGLARSSMVADNLMEQARGRYASNQHEDAIHLFSQVLLIQPRNAEALEYLKKMGLSGGIYGYHRTAVDHVHDLLIESVLYQQEILSLEEQQRRQAEQMERLMAHRRDLEAQIQRKEQEKDDLAARSWRFYEEATARGEEIDRLKQESAKKADDIAELKTDLVESRGQMRDDRDALKRTAAELEQVKDILARDRRAGDEQLREQAIVYERNILDLQEAHDRLKMQMAQMTDAHHDETSRIAESFRRAEADLMLERARLAVLSSQVLARDAGSLREQERADQLEQIARERLELETLIRQKEQERETLMIQGSETNAIAEMRLEEITRLREVSGQKIDELARLNSEIFEMKEQWAADRRALAVKEKELSRVQTDLEWHERTSAQERHEQKIAYESRILDLQTRRDALEREVFDVTKDRDGRTREMEDSLRGMEAELQRERSGRIAASHQLVEQEARLLKGREQIDILYQQRASLVTEAESLRDVIRRLRLDMEYPLSRGEDAGGRDNLAEHIKKQDEQLIYLKDRLAGFLEELGPLVIDPDLMSGQRAIELQEEITVLRGEIARREEEILFFKEQVSSLEAHVQDYQDRLEIVEGLIRDKEERIQILERESGADVLLKAE